MGRLIIMIVDTFERDERQIVEYLYDKENRIYKGTIFRFGDSTVIGNINFKHDSKGNTTERIETWIDTNDGDTIIYSQVKFTYDNKINPLKISRFYLFDIVQNNNPTYYYRRSDYMSRPDEYYLSYDYDASGLPIREYKQYPYFGSLYIYDYEYIDKN